MWSDTTYVAREAMNLLMRSALGVGAIFVGANLLNDSVLHSNDMTAGLEIHG
jgi:hypothetical protein